MIPPTCSSFSGLLLLWGAFCGSNDVFPRTRTNISEIYMELLPIQFRCLLFLLPVGLLWLGLPVLCWIREVKPDIPVLFSILIKENTCSFCLLSVMLAVDLSYTAFVMFRYVPSIPTLLRVFIINECWILPNAFSASINMIILFMWWITFIDLQCCTNLALPE